MHHMGQRGTPENVGRHTVNKLNRCRVVDEVLPNWSYCEQACWDHLAVHAWPCVERHACIETGHQSAQKNLQQNQAKQRRALPGKFGLGIAIMSGERSQDPNRHGKDNAGHCQMDGEPDLTDINPVHQPGFDHPPTNEPLQSAKCQQDQQAGLQPGCQPAGYPEPGERQGEKQTDKTSQKTVSPFPPKDELEFFKRHMFVDRLKLGRSLVLFELSQPVEVRQRWDSAAQRRPFCDR